ncbi:MAG TPA: recombination regulator RecX [Bacillota bacterium]|nr:recombination regulator RecX [Bacillota bacterium]
MAVISRITTQKKNSERYNIFLDDGAGETYGFSVNEAVLIKYRLRKGMQLDDSLMIDIKRDDAAQKAYALAINYLSYRMRTKQEVYDYLQKKAVDEADIARVMKKLEVNGLLDDAAFAEAFVNTRMRSSTKGPRLVKQELQEKGVSLSVAEAAIDAYTFEIQYEKAKKWAAQKLSRNTKQAFKKQLAHLQSSLLRKGFTPDVIEQVVQEFQNMRDDDAEWKALEHHGKKLLKKHQDRLSGAALKQKMKEALYRKGFSLEQIHRYLHTSIDDKG